LITTKNETHETQNILITGGVVGGGLLVGIGGFNYYVNKRINEFSGIGMAKVNRSMRLSESIPTILSR